jgi:hypothetical protein
MYTDSIMGLVGKDVEVVADGMLYRGRLIEVSETDVFLQSDLGWIQLQVELVTEIRPAG